MPEKTWAAGIGVIGVLGLATAGYIQITTPEHAQCSIELAGAEVRLELLTEATEACAPALETCLGIIGGAP
jgi:hypothetical protein